MEKPQLQHTFGIVFGLVLQCWNTTPFISTQVILPARTELCLPLYAIFHYDLVLSY